MTNHKGGDVVLGRQACPITGKLGFRTKSRAKRYAKDNRRSKQAMKAYRCFHCGNFHHTSMTYKQLKRKGLVE